MYIPRPLGDAVASSFTGGIKGVRYLLSSHYRALVRQHWQVYPNLRTRGILRMVWGTVFDAAIVWFAAFLLTHRQ
jgi:hypothetical protein